MKRWPAVSYPDIFNYLVLSEGYDGGEMQNYKSMDSFNYFKSGKVGALLVGDAGSEGVVYIKGHVTPSYSVKQEQHSAWVLCSPSGIVHTAGCSCKAGLGRSCSHAGALLWKLESAERTGRSGKHAQTSSNSGTGVQLATLVLSA